jgi:hypothetical protein
MLIVLLSRKARSLGVDVVFFFVDAFFVDEAFDVDLAEVLFAVAVVALAFAA